MRLPWVKDCAGAVRLQHPTGRDLSFQYIHADGCGIIFYVRNGGHIFTQAVRVVSDNTTVLDLAGSDATNAFFHINGLALDDGVDGVVLLNNDDSGNGTQHVRFTNAHFQCTDTTSPCPPPSSSSGESANCHPVSVLIDRTGSSSLGKTMLELIGCRGVSALDLNVLIKGASASHKSHLVVQESEIARVEYLIDGASSNYTYAGLENWTFPCGLQTQTDEGAA